MGWSLKPREPVFLDDRGRALNLASQEVIAEQIWENKKRTVAGILVGVVTYLAAAACFLWLVSTNWPPTWVDVAWFGTATIAGPWVVRLVAWRRNIRVPAQAAVLAAHRRCGACGYDLHQIDPEEDGCAVCPECGASWHRERFVFEHEDLKESTLLAKAAEGDAFAGQQDDRGMPLVRAVRWPPWWLDYDPRPARRTAEFAKLADEMRRDFLRRRGPLAAVLWLGLAGIFIWRADDRAMDHVLLVAIVTLLISAIVLFALWRVYLDRVVLQAVPRALGICLNCGQTLARDGAATFDGCAVCAGCKRAWKVGGSERADRTPDSTKT